MKLRNSLIAITFTLVFACTAFGAITAEEAKQLGGPVLTEIGAERAGNKDGTIPAYTGGLTTPPPYYKKGSFRYVDPFRGEKPLFSINKDNYTKYADKMTEGQKALVTMKPGFRMDVYPTHRTAAYPEYVRKNTIKISQTTQIIRNGNSFEGGLAGYPFPIAKTGIEVLWNHLMAFRGVASIAADNSIFFVDAGGRVSLNGKGIYGNMAYYWHEKNPSGAPYIKFKGMVNAPPRMVGQNYLTADYIGSGTTTKGAWAYMVGQRRIRAAPDISYDTPNPVMGGSVMTCDDAQVFNGMTDRFSWKLIGKKEMYIPYNCFRLLYEGNEKTVFSQKYINPDYVRWELHRVWVVEGTVIPGRRHLYSRRVLYIDEDTWSGLASDSYDQKGKFYRSVFAYPVQAYDQDIPYAGVYGAYDFVAGGYNLGPLPFDGVIQFLPDQNPKDWVPEALASGVF